MARPLVGLVGILAALFPDRMIDIFEAAAIANSDEYTPKSWISAGIRTEGVLVAVASLTGGRAYAWMMNLTGLFGAIVLLFPQLYRRFATKLLYEESDRIMWNEQFTNGVRLIGVLYVLLAVRAFNKRRAKD